MLPLPTGKVVFVSGGSQRLGAAIARAAGREGAEAVVVKGRRPEVRPAPGLHTQDGGRKR